MTEYSRNIHSVYVFETGNVLVFSKTGHQIPELSGNWTTVLPKLKNTYQGIIHWNQDYSDFRRLILLDGGKK
jgi:hypothetical protein